ncbi:hypothetical protein MRB53_037730 [Persea americana]|nr:hypothetical protein MRB53_037730 [Persea americana]
MYLIREARSLNALLDERLVRRVNTAYGSGDIGSWVPDFTCLSTPEPEPRQRDHRAGKGWPDVRLVPNEDPRIPSILRIGAVSFDRIRTRTTQAQLPPYESSPSGRLIYPDLQQPGKLVVELLKILDDPRFSHFQHSEEFELGRTPHVGLLILDYLFDGRRTVHGELKRRRGRAETNLEDFYREELAADLDHVDKEGSSEDRHFVQAHWRRKLSYLSNNDVDISRAVDVNAWPWNDLIASTDGNRSYQEVTFDFENLFLFARAGGQYHFFGDKFDIPLRAGLLACRDDAEMRQKLPMDYRHRNEDIEIHPYARKARHRDFFRTENGFLGLGPASLEVGDLVVVPFGCAYPLILRERPAPARRQDRV